MAKHQECEVGQALRGAWDVASALFDSTDEIRLLAYEESKLDARAALAEHRTYCKAYEKSWSFSWQQG